MYRVLVPHHNFFLSKYFLLDQTTSHPLPKMEQVGGIGWNIEKYDDPDLLKSNKQLIVSTNFGYNFLFRCPFKPHIFTALFSFSPFCIFFCYIFTTLLFSLFGFFFIFSFFLISYVEKVPIILLPLARGISTARRRPTYSPLSKSLVSFYK